jgi:hypothetical protein
VKPSVIYELVGYDRKTERMAERYPVPRSLVRTVKQIAGIGDRRDDQLGDWELSAGQAHEIGKFIKASPEVERCDFFLAPSAADKPSRPAHGRKTTVAK